MEVRCMKAQLQKLFYNNNLPTLLVNYKPYLLTLLELYRNHCWTAVSTVKYSHRFFYLIRSNAVLHVLNFAS